METAPYAADCQTLWNEYGQASISPDAAFTIGPISSVNVTASLEDMMQVLASNRALAYGTRLYTDWPSYDGTPVPYVGNGVIMKGANGKPAGHCMLIIGYDTTIGPNGAVKLQNSQGTSWGSSGYVWMDCKTFQALAQGQASYVND